MSGYCPDCGNQMCICDEIQEWRDKMEIIQITQEQANSMLLPITHTEAERKSIIETWNIRGYIKKSVVDEAEEMYEEYKKNWTIYDSSLIKVVEKQHKAIQELKEQIK